MFGGYGLYHGRTFFGIIFRGQLYFKTNEATRGRYVRSGMRPFRPSAKQTLKSYYEVPPEVLEGPDELVAWAQEAIGAKREAGDAK
jgi:DNA transformation protein